MPSTRVEEALAKSPSGDATARKLALTPLATQIGAWFLVFPFWLINKDGWVNWSRGYPPKAEVTKAVEKVVESKDDA